jgi:hypothetical protein
MNKIVSRSIRGLAVLATAAALPLALTGTAHASPVTVPTLTSDVTGYVATNVDVPRDAIVHVFSGGEIHGNVTVEGTLVSFGGQFDGNFTVNGGSLSAVKGGITVLGNLPITNSPGAPDSGQNGFYNEAAQSYIGGSFYYSYPAGARSLRIAGVTFNDGAPTLTS